MVSFTSKIPFAFLLLLSVVSFNGSICNGSSGIRCHQSDQRLLQIFKQGVNDSYNLLSSWSSQQDCCAWKGVHCDNITGRVTRLDLNLGDPIYHIYLRGEINLSLLELEFLNYLDLSWNGFETVRYHNRSLATPYVYANFSSNLHYLDFSRNPDLHMDNLHWLSLVPSLKYLNLSHIELYNETNWLQSMAVLPSLSVLILRRCSLPNISPSLEYVNFTSLETLDLSNNYLRGQIPPSLEYVNFTSLETLDLSNNYLRGQIPKSLLNSQNLKLVDFSYNKLNGSIPDWCRQLEHLQHLDLSHNLFYGSIPSSLGNCSSLVYLDISFNGLSGNLPESLGQLSKLESLLVGGNSLTGFLSETYLKGFTNLKELNLGYTGIALDLGPNWIPPFQLHKLNLKSLILGPNFPPWIYTQRSLEVLDISSTRISSIDENIFWNFVGGISSTLNMSNNSISGDISNILLNTPIIILASNSFTGALPRISKNVFLLDMSNNSFTGSISSLLCHDENKGINQLVYLDLSSNLLTGELPHCWAKWRQLWYIYLGNNRLTGELSPSLGSLLDLYLIDLRNNSFYGEIPSSLQSCKKLQFINFERNKFSGSIPTWMQQSIMFLQLRSNHFVGKIPPQVCQLSSLLVLDMADNKLLGSIPQCLYNITAMVDDHFPDNMGWLYKPYSLMLFMKGLELEYINNLDYVRSFDLSMNNLSGEIPWELFNLTGLISLNLSQNHLMGKIPKNIGDMKQLESLDLSNNQLFDEIPQSISNLNFLSYLNLSYNDFSGQIPTGPQLQTFDAWSYIGNPQLCGPPLTKNCIKEEKSVAEEHGKFGTESWFYLGMGVGFAVGFGGVCGAIFFNRAFRHAYFRLLALVADKVYVFVALNFSMFQW